MTVNEFELRIDEAKISLKQIDDKTEKIVNESILDGGTFGSGGWKDACGKRIGKSLIDAVNQAMREWLNIYACVEELDKIKSKLRPVVSAVEAAKKELQ